MIDSVKIIGQIFPKKTTNLTGLSYVERFYGKNMHDMSKKTGKNSAYDIGSG